MVPRSRATDRRHLLHFLAGATVALTAALAAPMPVGASPPGSEATVGECLDAGEVWLLIRTEEGQVLRSECVGAPKSGREALGAAAVATARAPGGYLCSLAGHPDPCPRRFTDRYWQYWRSPGVGAGWAYSERGPDRYRPAPGSIEGWCYNGRGERRCELPLLAATDRPADRVDLASARASTNGWATVGFVLVAIGVAVHLRSRFSGRRSDLD